MNELTDRQKKGLGCFILIGAVTAACCIGAFTTWLWHLGH